MVMLLLDHHPLMVTIRQQSMPSTVRCAIPPLVSNSLGSLSSICHLNQSVINWWSQAIPSWTTVLMFTLMCTFLVIHITFLQTQWADSRWFCWWRSHSWGGTRRTAADVLHWYHPAGAQPWVWSQSFEGIQVATQVMEQQLVSDANEDSCIVYMLFCR